MEGRRMLFGILTLPFVTAYIISCPSEYRGESVRDDCSSLSFKSDFIIKFNLFRQQLLVVIQFVVNLLRAFFAKIFLYLTHMYFLLNT